MASDKKRRKDAKHKTPRATPQVHPDGDRRRRGGPSADEAVRNKKAQSSFWDMPPPPPEVPDDADRT
jgi:hypothetical protein